MKNLLLFSVIVFLFNCSLSAQYDVEIIRREFKTDKPGFEAAWKHIKKGDSYYLKKGLWYSNALTEYTLANNYNNSNAELNYKIGVCELFSDKKDEAYVFFNKAYLVANDVAPDIVLLTGKALQYAGKYKDATDKLNSYLSSPENKPKKSISFANRALEQCTSALKISEDTVRVEIMNMGGNINSESDDYSIVLTPDGQKMYFASRRAYTSKQKNKYKDTKLDENIYTSDNMRGTWTMATIAGKNLVTPYCETPLFFNKELNKLYVYVGYEGGGDIQVSESKKGLWKAPVPEKFGISTKYPETSFCISPKNDEIAFVSDRGRHGEGGKDIWFKEKKNGRKYFKSVNAGPAINSPHDEESVSFSKGGDTLWFSSAGHNTMGGYDIFYSVRNSSGVWGQAVNAGYPINTPWDDLFYVPNPAKDSSFYFVSNRSGGLGGLDIYTGKLLPPPPPKPVVVPITVVKDTVKIVAPPPPPPVEHKPDTVFIRDTVVIVKQIAPIVKDTVKIARDTVVAKPALPKELILYLIGKVTDSESGGPVLARIDVIDLKTNQVITTTASSDVDGSYRVKLQEKGSYMIDLRAAGFLSDIKKVSIPETYPEEFFTLNLTLTKVKIGKKIILNNILFQLGKAVLTTSSNTELDKLVELLKDNSAMKIEISGHTDNTGSPVVNAKLSSDRAKAVVDYLVMKGIDRSRLTYRGYGPDQPIADNTTEAGRSKNRRVEFKILEF